MNLSGQVTLKAVNIGHVMRQNVAETLTFCRRPDHLQTHETHLVSDNNMFHLSQGASAKLKNASQKW